MSWVRGGISGCVSGAVERTSDGGRTYHVVLRTRQPIGYLQAIGANGAIATTFRNDSWRTLDGGKTWQKVSPNRTVDWLNQRVGARFRSSDSHGALTMLVTDNGGRTWQRRSRPLPERDVAFSANGDLVTPELWWVVCEGQRGAGNEDKAIYRTRNGGRTWEAGAATVFGGHREREHGGVSTYGYPVGLAFARDGWGLLTESRGTLYVTRDGGAHFHAEPHVAHPEADFAGGAAAFSGGSGYVFLGEPIRACSGRTTTAVRGRSCGAGASRASLRRRGRAPRASFRRSTARGCPASRVTARRPARVRPRPPCRRP